MPKNKPDILDLLFLLTIPQIGPGRIRRLFQSFNSLEEIRKAPAQLLQRIEGFDRKLIHYLKSAGDFEAAEKQYASAQKHQVKFLSIWDAEYPDLLKRISDPPVLLFYRGEFSGIGENCIAVVGTRTPTNYGKIISGRLVKDLVNCGFVIVSGMARGIDTISHRSAIQAGGKTIAVLGNGMDRCYPAENRAIFDKIPQNHGAVCSEYFMGVGPDAINFPKRNRIISGLCRGTLVIEAGRKSGTLITALYALNSNREVFAVPGNINSLKSHGTNDLIKQGAKLVQNVDDILDELGGVLAARKTPPQREIPKNLNAREKAVLENLNDTPVHIDKLVQLIDESPANILSALLTLELLGLVQQLPGKMFVLH